MSWYTEGKKTFPVTGDLLADTGAVGIGSLTQFTFVIAMNLSATVVIHHRNALNNADLHSQYIWVSGSVLQTFQMPVILGTSERLTVTMGSDTYEGTEVQVSILT